LEPIGWSRNVILLFGRPVENWSSLHRILPRPGSIFPKIKLQKIRLNKKQLAKKSCEFINLFYALRILAILTRIIIITISKKY